MLWDFIHDWFLPIIIIQLLVLAGVFIIKVIIEIIKDE